MNDVFRFVVLWATLLMSQGMVVLVSQTATANLTGSQQPNAQAVNVPASALGDINPLFFAVIAVMIAAVAIFIPRILFAAAQKRLAPDAPMPVLAKAVLPIWLIRWALIESITLVGFCASMLSAMPAMIFPYAAAGLLGFALTFPSEQKIRAKN